MLSRASSRLGATFATRRFASTLVVAEHDAGALAPATLGAVSAAKAVGGPVTVLVTGPGTDDVAASAAQIDGVESVLHSSDDCLAGGVAENVAATVLAAQEANSYSHIFATSSNFGKAFIPRVAAKLDVAPLTDIMSIEGEDTFTRPTYAGNAIAKVKSSDSVKVGTIRTTNFEKAAAEGGSAAVAAHAGVDAGLSKFVSEEKTKSDRPDLGAAEVVVAGGRGLKNGENFEMLYALADKLGAAVGASRAAVDAGYVPNDMQIGQTGKVIAPNLYIAFGISGAIQHLAGMKDSKTIVAVNKDPEAPIFQVSDYGIVDDLFKVVPELDSKL